MKRFIKECIKRYLGFMSGKDRQEVDAAIQTYIHFLLTGEDKRPHKQHYYQQDDE